MATHLLGAFYVTQPAFGAGYGRIVFTSSLVGVFGSPWRAAYGAAKGGVIGLMNTVAVEGEWHGILRNAIPPGALTRMGQNEIENVPPDLRETVDAFVGLKTGLTPDYVTPMVLYLASEHCRVTHAMYSAIAGRYARVFIGLTEGWQEPTTVPASREDIETHLAAIEDPAGYIIPSSGVDGLRAIATARQQNH